MSLILRKYYIKYTCRYSKKQVVLQRFLQGFALSSSAGPLPAAILPAQGFGQLPSRIKVLCA